MMYNLQTDSTSATTIITLRLELSKRLAMLEIDDGDDVNIVAARKVVFLTDVAKWYVVVVVVDSIVFVFC